jgi:hypothetical protein
MSRASAAYPEIIEAVKSAARAHGAKGSPQP